MVLGIKTQQIVDITLDIARATPEFHKTKGPGTGDKANHAFMKELQKRAKEQLRTDYSETKIIQSDNSIKSAFDFYIPEEKTVIEIALTLKLPQSEFYKDIVKVLLARDRGLKIEHLVFVAKTGGKKRHESPMSKAIIEWLKEPHEIAVEIIDME